MSAQRKDLWLLVGAWLLIGALMAMLSWPNIVERKFPDPDDVMRLVQVRDWIGGQSWFDVTQYRLNPPAGVPMHWSRLVDVPIAAVILIMRPFVGQDGAETAALIAVPLVTLGISMLLVQRIALNLMGSRPALAAAIATPFSLGGLKQMRPMRIDHHGWQIVMALVGLLAAMDEKPRRSGIVSGFAMALWMNISIEGLPFAAAFGALYAWQWLADRNSTERLKSYLGSLAVSSIVLFALTHFPSTWASQLRDVVTLADLAAFSVAALSCGILVRSSIDKLQTRIALLGAAGALTLAAMFAVDPHWLVGPFGSLDPLVRQMWYLSIDEGLPMWQIDWGEAATGISQPLVGLIGAAFALSRTSGTERNLWMIYTFVLGALALGGVFVIRTETTASVTALPGTAFLCSLALGRARNISIMPVRVAASAAAVFIMTPAYAFPLSVAPPNQPLAHAFTTLTDCMAKGEVEKLQSLPKGEIAALFDITPSIILDTSHRAVASGHHRNVSGMHDVIELFLSPPNDGVKIIARRQVDYLVFCPGAPESIRYSNRAPHGLAAALEAGKEPTWLEPVSLPGLRALKVWRVRKDVVAGSVHA
jgi:hypothetical protein